MAQILTPQQELALEAISQSNLAKQFYFSGGTALSHFYLQHRLSEDLDFFRLEEFSSQSVYVEIKALKKKLGYLAIDFQKSFNRNLFFLEFSGNYTLKLEFTYFPFTQIEKPQVRDGLQVDSPVDIAANKLFTIAQKARGRDYYDLYFLVKKYQYSIEKLRMLAKQKFDWHIDPLLLASKLFEVDKYLDDPILLAEFDRQKLSDFFQQEAQSMRTKILEN